MGLKEEVQNAIHDLRRLSVATIVPTAITEGIANRLQKALDRHEREP